MEKSLPILELEIFWDIERKTSYSSIRIKRELILKITLKRSQMEFKTDQQKLSQGQRKAIGQQPM